MPFGRNLDVSLPILRRSSQLGTMELLTNGSVLMTDGGNQWAILTPSSSGSYVNGTWKKVSDANYSRLYDATQVLQSGQVFVAGGEYGNGAATGELYNPLTNTWTSLPSQSFGSFIDSGSMLLPNGNVLIAPVAPNPSGYTTIFNTATNTWSQGPEIYRGGSMDEQSLGQTGRRQHSSRSTAPVRLPYIPSLEPVGKRRSGARELIRFVWARSDRGFAA